MKAVSVLCPESGLTGGVTANRVIARGGHHQRKDIENEEIQMYLSKLKDLVPFMPKNRKLSKLEVIQHVIDYICDLQSALETHPSVGTFDPTAALTGTTTGGLRRSQNALSPRQPLGVRTSPNTILGAAAPCEAPALQHVTTPEKLSPSDGRPVLC